MPVLNSTTSAQLQHNKLGHLDTFIIHGDGFRAVVLKQGAQLIHFLTEDDINNQKLNDKTEYGDNWLWVSQQAEYNQGESVRGGVPICWPVFGQIDANPQAVKNSFSDVAHINAMPQHGFARLQPFELDSFSVDDENGTQTATLTLTLNSKTIDKRFTSSPNLALKVVFTFSTNGFGIELITQNNSDKTVTFSQALHTYLPTLDITQTHVSGFDKVTYSDALTVDADTSAWQTKTQQGNITFNSEVDRVYHDAPDVLLDTSSHNYNIVADNSHSTVVWNPWIEKSKQISQFADSDYQKMLCIETANAHLDVVTLGVGEVHSLSVKIQRDKKHEKKHE